MQQTRAAIHRLQVLKRVLSATPRFTGPSIIRVLFHTDGQQVSIGDVSKSLHEPRHPELVPRGYLKDNLSQWELRHLRWLLQKDNMGQDMFLIGGPGPLRRHIALSYLELTQQEAEYVTLTRDTTEADLKQRREIKDATSYYHDQAAVRAALHGRVLVLDGIEKAERNVLPVLNNLLENREMSLDDGRRLVAHNRYDALVEHQDVAPSSLLRVSSRFRVLALGLPCPPNQGQPLDPPLRSRFQARDVYPPPFEEQLQHLQQLFPRVPASVVSRCLSVAYAALAKEGGVALGLPDYPAHLLHQVLAVLNLFPHTSPESVLPLSFPHSLCLAPEAREAFGNLLETFQMQLPQADVDLQQASTLRHPVHNIAPVAGDSGALKVTLHEDGQYTAVQMVCGPHPPAPSQSSCGVFATLPQSRCVLASLLQLHAAGHDACVVGPRGCGKSTVVAELARCLGYTLEPILLYQDMTSRDLSQQRATDDAGNTVWRPSPLLQAAQQGKLAVLDGLHRLHANTTASLARLIQDRELQLHDGSRLLRHDRYDAIQASLGLTPNEMTSMGLLRVHPAFRVVALAEPPVLSGGGEAQGQWMKAEALALMPWLEMKTPTEEEMMALVQEMVQPSSAILPQVQQLVQLSCHLAATSSGSLASLHQSLSLRQVLRIARRLHQYPGHLTLHQLIQDACLARFLPPLVKQALDETLTKAAVAPSTSADSELTTAGGDGGSELRCTVRGEEVTIGQTTAPRYRPRETSLSKVPKTLFFDIQQHVAVLESLLQDWLLGEHLLLIGNQGVGKNKLADRFLDLCNLPREYLQLHRDSTVQSLTVQPCVRDGRLTHEDSPLVTAVRQGHVLLLDEADKAPTHVTCVLKTLVECGEMLLSDNRRIVPPSHPLALSGADDVIVSHPDFRMIVLANRPGFPFLGNDFFAVLGDLFSCHAIHNPLPSSELALLASYGPDVSTALLARLVAAFGQLREMADTGKLQYPYSTREVVAVVRHLQHYPDDGVSAALRNVLDFDSWTGEAGDAVRGILRKHGLPVGGDTTGTGLASKVPLGAPTLVGRWQVEQHHPRTATATTRRTENISYTRPVYVPTFRSSLPPSTARASVFTELHSHYALLLPDTALITDVSIMEGRPVASHEDTNLNGSGAGDGGVNDAGPVSDVINFRVQALKDPFGTLKHQSVIHVATVAPVALHSLLPSPSLTRPLVTLNLHSVLPSLGGSHQPRLKLWHGTGEMVGLYEQLTNTVMLANPDTGEVLQLNTRTFLEKVALPLRQLTQQHVSNRCAPSGESLLVYTQGGDRVTVVNTKSGKVETVSLPIMMENAVEDGRGGWILEDEGGLRWLFGGDTGLDKVLPVFLEGLEGSVRSAAVVEERVIKNALNMPISVEDIVSCNGSNEGLNSLRKHSDSVMLEGPSDSSAVDTPTGVLLATRDTQAVLLPGFPHESSGSSYSWTRPRHTYDESDVAARRDRRLHTQYDSRSSRSVPHLSDEGRNCVIIPSSGQVVQSISELPPTAPEVLKSVPAAGYLEVTDLSSRCVSYLPVPHAEVLSEYWQWAVGRLAPHLMLAGGEGGVVSVDRGGGVRLWQVGGEVLQSAMAEWLSMVGKGDEERLEIKKEGGDMSLTAPKHGKLDPLNAPHVGGNTFAGGTGGRDTAGLGGVGGPYRLDAGHDVHQVSDEVKAAVPPEVTEAARKMARAAHKKRLKEIEMSEYDHEQYEALSKNVRAQVTQTRALLSSLTAKAGERWWVRRRPDGELDDMALVDGLAGAINIYRHRREVPPEAGQPQTKPKRLRLLLDASGSMYRFNGHDQRLQRSLEAALMLMEACRGHESRLVYDMYAHSGEDHSVPLCKLDAPPDNNKKRLDLLRTVLAHSQFCISGDSTVSATKHAMDTLAKTTDQFDQSFVILLSDANLDRYGISPNRLATAMTAGETGGNSSVQCYAVFIGSLGNQARRLADALPAGRAYVCLDVNNLPQIMQNIFTHAMTQ